MIRRTQCVQIFGELPRKWVNQTACNFRCNVSVISCSVNYTVVVFPISLLVYLNEHVSLKTVFW